MNCIVRRARFVVLTLSIFGLLGQDPAYSLDWKKCLTANISFEFITDPAMQVMPDWAKKIGKVVSFPVRSGVKLTVEPIAFPYRLSRDALISLYKRGFRGLMASRVKLIKEGGLAVAATVFWAYLADGTAISIVSFHSQTDDEFLPTDKNSRVVVINGFDPTESDIEALRFMLVDKMVDDRKSEYPRLESLRPENIEDLVEQLDAYAKKHGSIQHLDWYGHSLPGILALQKGSIGSAVRITKDKVWSDREILAQVGAETFADEAKFRFNSCYAGCSTEDSIGFSGHVFHGGESAAEMTARILTHGKGATVFAATTQTYPSGAAELVEFAIGKHIPPKLAQYLDLPFAQIRALHVIHDKLTESDGEGGSLSQIFSGRSIRKTHVSGTQSPKVIPAQDVLFPEKILRRNEYAFLEEPNVPLRTYGVDNDVAITIIGDKGLAMARLEPSANPQEKLAEFKKWIKDKGLDFRELHADIWYRGSSFESRALGEKLADNLEADGLRTSTVFSLNLLSSFNLTLHPLGYSSTDYYDPERLTEKAKKIGERPLGAPFVESKFP